MAALVHYLGAESAAVDEFKRIYFQYEDEFQLLFGEDEELKPATTNAILNASVAKTASKKKHISLASLHEPVEALGCLGVTSFFKTVKCNTTFPL